MKRKSRLHHVSRAFHNFWHLINTYARVNAKQIEIDPSKQFCILRTGRIDFNLVAFWNDLFLLTQSGLTMNPILLLIFAIKLALFTHNLLHDCLQLRKTINFWRKAPCRLAVLLLQHFPALLVISWSREGNRHDVHCLWFYSPHCELLLLPSSVEEVTFSRKGIFIFQITLGWKMMLQKMWHFFSKR